MQSFTPEQVQEFRNETVGTQNVSHLNNAGSGLMPDVVSRAQIAHIQLEAEIGGYEAAAFRANAIKSFYDQASFLLHCKPDNIAFTSSATDAYTRALSSIPFQQGDVILTDRDDFVSNQIQFLSLKKRMGIEIIHIQNALIGGVDLNDLREKLNRFHPKLLAITHIPTNSGLVQPVEEIAEIFLEFKKKYPGKTWYILDACQSIGQMTINTQKLGCDFLSATCRKFLRGPRGTGILYISDCALEAGLEPMFIDMRGAEWTEKDKYKQQSGARRYEDWEFAYSTVIGTSRAIEYCLKIGEDKIWQQVKFLSGNLRQKLSSVARVCVLDKGPDLGGLVTFTVGGGEPVSLVSKLLYKKINVVASYRAFGLLDFDEKGVKWAIRASPHYYNSIEEIDFFIESLKEIIDHS